MFNLKSSCFFDIDMTISAMLELLNLRENFIESDSVSVGGWIMENLGDIPASGDSFTYKDTIIFTVTQTDEQRVEKVNITLIQDDKN